MFRKHLYLKNKSFLHLFVRTVKTKPCRVRFAPSPTGFLHLGGLRTALYNYLFASSNNGKMILRIEDTDKSRKVEGAIEGLINDLEWVGIKFHEGPIQGGPFGPYIQSERTNIYQSEVQKLLNNGTAYKCFCSERRLNMLRRDSIKNRQVPGYDNKCRKISKEEIQQKLDRGNPYCIRFKLTSDCLTFDDLIYGTIAYDIASMEGDPVILKMDGLPTYHLANVIDDHLMQISHVLRGVEWQISTTKHILLYRAFGWEPPIFGHLPLIMNSDGSKLSKRQGDITVKEYCKKGIFPSALINYITLAGSGFDRLPGEGLHHFNITELINKFRLDLINSNSSRLNPDLLSECNRLAIVEMVKDENELNILCHDLGNMIKNELKNKKVETSTDFIRSVLKWSAGRISTLNELLSPSLAFIWVLPDVNLNLSESELSWIKKLIILLENEDKTLFEQIILKRKLHKFCDSEEIQFSIFMKLLRKILSGLSEGPGIPEIMEVLGKETVLQRLKNILL